MLKPSMKELMNKVGNRYLLVNLAAQRARDIAQECEESEASLTDKAVKLALDEIAAGTIVYCPGPKVESGTRLTNGLIPGMLDLDDHDDLESEENTKELEPILEDSLDDAHEEL